MNYKKVRKHFKNGTIDKNLWTLAIDNDGGYWNYIGPCEDEEAIEECRKYLENKYGTPDGYADVVDILNQVGIPAEWV